MTRWTCDCLSPVYEFRTAGGQYFIRRIEARSVTESVRARYHDADELWVALLVGHLY
ncbi:hypothetical protein ACIBG8_53985 [Nonomuraea sp. NPDC050556]|uniref:hypothetical protein n=1 Tax=Nonomuraea sp. NPDC050556 TaxID=3364369 RepID=UPI0037A3BE13